MTNWNSLPELLRGYDATIKIVHVLFGLYAWEWYTSLEFEWDFLTGKKKFKWPMVFYLLNRYCIMVLLALLLFMFDAPSNLRYNCPLVYKLTHLFGQVALVTATLNLTIRTIAIWGNVYVTVGLCLATMGHVVVLLLDVVFSNGTFLAGLQCGPANPSLTSIWLRVSFLYAVALDFTVLILNIYKLSIGVGSVTSRQERRKSNLITGGNKLAKMLFQQGLIYFFVALLTNVVSVVFLSIRLNLAMDSITIAPSQVFATIVACRAVRSLSNFNTEIDASQRVLISNRSYGRSMNGGSRLSVPPSPMKASFGAISTPSGIWVQTETVISADPSEKV